MNQAIKKRILNRKWQHLEAQGLIRPDTQEENQKRAMEAHQDVTVINIDDTRRSQQARGVLEAKRASILLEGRDPIGS